MKLSGTSALLGLAVAAAAQETHPTLPQATAISAGLVSVAKSVTANPTLESLISVLSGSSYAKITDVPAYESILQDYNGKNGGINVGALTSSISVPTQSWETLLPTSLKSLYENFETSFISAAQKVEATPLGISPGVPLPSSLLSALSSTSIRSLNSSSSISSSTSSANSTITSTSATSSSSSLGISSASISSSAGSSSSTSQSSSGAQPTNAAINVGLGAAVGVVGMAAAFL